MSMLELPRTVYERMISQARVGSPLEDIRLALTPDISYVIVSLADPFAPEVRSFRIVGGKAGREELRIVNGRIGRRGNGYDRARGEVPRRFEST